MNITHKVPKFNKTLFLVNIITVLFSFQAFSRCFYHYEILFKSSNVLISSLLTIIFCLIIFYTIHSFFVGKKFFYYKKIRLVVETISLLTIFSLIIILSGGYTSPYKPLFLLAIINITIQTGMKSGIYTSIISSGIIILIDREFLHKFSLSISYGNDIILLGIFLFCAITLGYYVDSNNKYITKLEYYANRDSLTGLYNHGYFHKELEKRLNVSKMTNSKLSLMFLDIDDFKVYNDINGHQYGDNALKSLANILLSLSKKDNIVARYGGEEFVILMSNTSEEEALLLAENIRSTIEKTTFLGEENQPKGKLTVSIGVSEFPGKAKDSLQLIKSADDALYRAKIFYKNRVESYISIFEDVKNKVNSEDKEVVTSIKTLISIINAKDKYTYGHTERVVSYSRLIAEKLNLNDEDKEILLHGAYLHDIGKINIPGEILTKKMPLEDNEWLALKEHPVCGYDIIKNVDLLKDVAPLVLYHHERYDGCGYPYKLKGETIPYLARILTVVDSFDAMTSNRPYNKCKSFEQGKKELLKCSGTQFDPKIVKAFIEVIDEILVNNYKYCLIK